MTLDWCVIGDGLVGAACAWALARHNPRGSLIGIGFGPKGVLYSSHDDDARMVRTSHMSPYWQVLSRRNLEQMTALTRDGEPPLLRELPVRYRRLDGGETLDDRGGIVDPRRYVALLCREIERLGATSIQAQAEVESRRGDRLVIRAGDRRVEAALVIDAGGLLGAAARRRWVQVVGKLFIFVESDRWS